MNSPSHLSRLFAGIAVFGLLIAGVEADTVKLKSGETLEGKITTEGSDFIKLEIAVSATIKDTKIIPRSDIAEIVKAAPDDTALSDLRKQLPAPSLMSAEAYRNLISTGPEKFLEQFPSSQHKAEVEKILADLKGELDKVERGFVKVEGEWMSPQERKQFPSLTDAKIRGVVMKRKLSQGDLLGALRDFEVLDERYFGTPTHAEALPTALEVLPAFGQRLTRALQDVEYRNQKWEQDKGLLDEVARAQVEAARAQEVANFERAVEREKAAGVKWLTISDNSAASLSGAIELVKAEIARLKELNATALKSMAEQLVQADNLIAEQKLAEARVLIEQATAMVDAGGSKSNFKKPSSGKPKSDEAFVPSSYADALYHKISEAEAAMELARKQEEEAAKGEEASALTKADAGKEGEAPTADPGEAAAEGEKPADQGSALTGLMGAGKKDGEEESSEGTAKKSTPPKKTPTKKTATDDGEVDQEPRTVATDDGGGLNLFQMIMAGVAALMVIAIVVMKVLGVGGKKEGKEG